MISPALGDARRRRRRNVAVPGDCVSKEETCRVTIQCSPPATSTPLPCSKNEQLLTPAPHRHWGGWFPLSPSFLVGYYSVERQISFARWLRRGVQARPRLQPAEASGCSPKRAGCPQPAGERGGDRTGGPGLQAMLLVRTKQWQEGSGGSKLAAGIARIQVCPCSPKMGPRQLPFPPARVNTRGPAPLARGRGCRCAARRC